jgi:hypothetical protein
VRPFVAAVRQRAQHAYHRRDANATRDEHEASGWHVIERERAVWAVEPDRITGLQARQSRREVAKLADRERQRRRADRTR